MLVHLLLSSLLPAELLVSAAAADVTAPELEGIVREARALDPVLERAAAEGTLRVVSSGSDLPVIDLRRVRF